MPYIKEEQRDELLARNAKNCGELNHDLTLVCLTYLRDKGESYQVYNDIVGALDNCKSELYRRKIAPYEDKKIVENGDVY